MTMTNSKMRSTAIAALLSLPLASGASFAQQSQGTDQTQQQPPASQDAGQSQTGQAQTGQSATASGQTASGQTAGTPQVDAVVAKVGDAEILGSDVLTVIGMLPPQLQSQPPQMLVPMALQQLILRELVLEQARGQNLASDPDVIALVEGSTQAAEEDAMVQVWLDRETASAVTDESVQSAYDQAKAQGQQDLPPVEEVRPQIEQYLRQQAMQSIGARLQQGATIVLYDAMGQPVEQQSGSTSTGQSDSGDTTSGTTSGGQSTGGGTGTSDTSGTTAPKN